MKFELKNMPKVDYSPRGCRKFALTMAAACAFVFIVMVVKGRPVGAGMFGMLSAAFAALGLYVPEKLETVYRAWMIFAVVLGKIVSRLLLSVFFFLMIMPMGLLLKILGKDILGLKIDKDQNTYWLTTDKKDYPPEYYERLF